MKSLLIFSCLLALSLAVRNPEWESFKTKFNKKYLNPTEEAFRRKIFLDNKMAADQHNKLFEKEKSTFTMGINKFSDMTTQEFNEQKLSYYMTPRNPSRAIHVSSGGVGVDVVDWRTQGAVTPVKDQGNCSAGYAFAAVGSMESILQIQTGVLVDLSEQNIIDCSGPEGNEGCTSGIIENCFDYAISNGGVDTEVSYPYEGKVGTCRFLKANVGGTIINYVDILKGKEEDLAEAVAKQPVAAPIDASHPEFKAYTGGVYFQDDCSPINLNHAVLIVGFGTEAGENYWLCKNSYGTDWGENGYIRMSTNRLNNCGIASGGSYPVCG